MNRLADQTSPYLRQHASNPVDWYPWGDEAFAAAVDRSCPILLSVGYSACHWCHVMAHESFEDDVTAALMNRWFVNVKVDREERPDVDAIYMEAVQTMTGRGGWPMTVLMTPDGRPFHGGTYYPPEPRHGMPSFRQLLERAHEAWEQERDAIEDQAERLTATLGRMAAIAPDTSTPSLSGIDEAVASMAEDFDPEWGGFGQPPKFPQLATLDLMLAVHDRTGNDDLLAMVTTTLDAMASGGIYDHLGGGFARYSTDRMWLVPHFEKMLYDNAQFVRAYLHGWQVTGREDYRQIVDETIGYVLGELALDGGGFASAEDADTEGEEGRYYVFTVDEINEIVGADAGEAMAWYGVTAAGNFEGRNILHRPRRGNLRRPEAIENARIRLLAARSRRVRPGLDDKVLTEWNALMTSSLAEAAGATGETVWLDAARENAEFLCGHLRRDGRWQRSWQAEGGARHLAYASDLAALIDAFVRLAEASGEARWIREASDVANDLLNNYWDHEHGGLFTTADDAEPLVTRPKDLVDTAIPSTNAMAALALLRLSALTGSDAYVRRAEAILRLLGRIAVEHPQGFAHLLTAAELHAGGITEVVVTGERPDLRDAVLTRHLPSTVVAWGEPYDSPLWEHREAGFAHVCRNHLCRLPVAEPDALLSELDAVR